MNDVAKLFPFGTAVRTAFPNSEVFAAEPFVQARSTVVLTTAYDQMGISKRFSAYLTDEAFGNFVDKIVIVATTSARSSRHDMMEGIQTAHAWCTPILI